MSNQFRGKILKSSIGVSGATFLSRILGLVRVMLEARVLGGDTLASAWGLAFAIPNTFRRLLGEGALGTALIPLISETEAQGDPAKVRRELGVVFAVLGVLLGIIVVAVSGGAIGLYKLFTIPEVGERFPVLVSPRILLALKLLPWLMPYAFFICLVGVTTAVLNTRKVFVLPALGALLLNFFLIGGLAAAWRVRPDGDGLHKLLFELSHLVLFSGMVQLALMLLLLYKCRRFPDFSKSSFSDCSILSRLWHLVLPGLIGSAALQISFLVDRTLAICLGAKAVPALNYVDRIIDIPIGIFAISLGSVLTATMSRAAAKGKTDELAGDLEFSLRHVYFICVPLGILVMFFWEPMLRTLCLGGNYTQEDLMAARMVAIFYGAGIPAFCSVKILLAPFNARKLMHITLRYSLIAIAVNIVLNLCLMWHLRQGGIALATVLASMVNNLLLMRHLYRDKIVLSHRRLGGTFLRSLAIALVAAAVMHAVYGRIFQVFARSVLGEFPALILLCVGFGVIYFIGALLARAPELKEFRSTLRR